MCAGSLEIGPLLFSTLTGLICSDYLGHVRWFFRLVTVRRDSDKRLMSQWGRFGGDRPRGTPTRRPRPGHRAGVPRRSDSEVCVKLQRRIQMHGSQLSSIMSPSIFSGRASRLSCDKPRPASTVFHGETTGRTWKVGCMTCMIAYIAGVILPNPPRGPTFPSRMGVLYL